MNGELRVRLNENGRVVIPASVRKMLGMNAGDELILRVEDDELHVTTMQKRLERAQRLVRKYIKPGASLADELIADRRREARNE
jgi:AbrB family looped-hinge helix DNA binding protein